MRPARDDQSNPTTLSQATCRRIGRGGALCAVVVLVAACSAETREKGLSGTGGSSGSGGVGGDGGTGAVGGDAGAAGDGGSAGNAGSAGTGATAGASGSAGTAGAGGTGATGGTAGAGGVAGSAGSGGTSGTGGTAGSGGNPCGNTDPDCECSGTQIVAKDGDNDQHGSKDCNANPGDDCDDNDTNFVKNACGGCVKNLGGMPGANCNDCGTFQCSGMDALQCVSPNPAPKRCGNATTPETCVSGSWVASAQCTGSKPACYAGACEICAPGTFKCVSYPNGDTGIVRCDPNTLSWASSGNVLSCFIANGQQCNAATGKCIQVSFLDRDSRFQVPSLFEEASPREETFQQILDDATRSEFS
ncbi:MAG: hypothetical protein AB7K71_26005 [Polyangiaceae bacterium]